MKNSMELINSGSTAWFKQWFNSSFYHQLYAKRDEKEAADFIDELVMELHPLPQSTMLDLGCGTGRHAKQLASKGFFVTGMDLASSSIRSAKKLETANLSFHRQDMRMPFGNDRFDYVFNFFTSFGYFGNEEENQNVVNNIANALKPGGHLVLDYINATWSENRLVPEEEKEIDGIVYHITRWTDERNFYKKIEIDNVQAKGKYEYVEQVAKFSLADFDCLFKRAGLQLQKLYGDYLLHPYSPSGSPRLILLAKKS